MDSSSPKPAEEMYKIPFDMFQRYRIVADLVNAIRPKDRLSVLDVGGWPGHMKGFLPNDQLAIVDLQQVKGVEAIIGEGRALPIVSGSYDVVLAIDIMEHLPASGRLQFLEELLRVTNTYMILAGPFEDPDVRAAELSVYEFTRDVLKVEHRFLEEHITNGLPDIEEVRKYLNEKGLRYVEVPNGYLYHWLAMMLANQFIQFYLKSSSINELVNESYNRDFYRSDNRDPCYRRALVISKSSPLDSRVLTESCGVKRIPKGPNPTIEPQLVRLLFRVIDQTAIGDLQKIIHARDEALAYQSQVIGDLQKIIHARDKELESVKNALPVKLYLSLKNLLKKGATTPSHQ